MFTEKDWVPFTHEELGIEKEEEIASAPKGLKGDFILPDGTRVKGEDSKYLFQEPPTFGEFTGKMIGAGVDQVQGLGYGAVGLFGDLAGSETVKQFGLEGFQRNMQEAAIAREDVGMVDFTDIDGVGSAGKWAYGTLMEQLPQLLPTIGLGGAGGIVGKQLVKKGLQEVIETGVASGLSRQAAEAAVANAVATRGGAKAFLTGAVDKNAAGQLMRGGFTREATEQSLGKIAAGKLAPQAGVAAGNIASGQAMSMGSIYGETEDAGLAVGYGAAAGAVEGLADTILFSPFTKRAFGVDVADRVAKNRSLPKEIGKGFVKGVAVEGPLEEYPQTYIEQMARAEADPTFDINSEEAKRERLNAMAAGSVVGGTIGPVGGALEALAPRTKEALDRFTQKPLSDPETGLPAEPQAPQAREYDPEPVTLENGTVLRRFKVAGTSQEGWAVESAPSGALNEVAKANAAFFDDGKLILAPGFTASATLIQRAEDARAKALGKIDDKEVEEKATPKSLTPFLFDDSGTEVEPDPNADVVKDFGIATPPVKFKPAPEALGRRVRYEGYEGVLAQDGERYKLRVDDKTDVELPANAEVETAEPVPLSSVRGDTALTTAVRTDESGDLVKDFAISQDGQTAKSSGSYPEAEGSTPSPATPDIDAINEIAKATLNLEPVGIVDALEEVSKTEALDDNAISLLDDAQRALEDGITQIESRDLSPDAKKKATDSLYAKLDQVDRIQQRFVPDKEPSTKLPPAPLEKELEAAQVEYERKLAEQQQATKQATEDRTPEQTQAFVAGLKQGDQVIVDLDGSDDIVGSVQGTTDEGAVIVRDKKTKKPRVVSQAMQDRVALAPEELAVPNLVRVIQNALGVKPTAKTLTSLGFTPTEEVISEKVESTVHTESPVYAFKAPSKINGKRDHVDQRPLDLRATFYKDNKSGETVPNLFYEHTNDTTNQPETQVRNMLRAMDRGYEVRISNNVEAPLGVQTTPVEGTNYRVVTGIQDFRWSGARLGSFVWGDRGLRDETGAEGVGTFSDLWQRNSDIQAQRGARSQKNNQTRQERGTDATTGAAKRAQGFNEIGTSIYKAIADGDYGARINYMVNGDDLSGASPEARDDFRDKATNKLINALGGAGLNEAIDIAPEQRPLIQTAIDAYLEKQSAEKSKTIEGGKLGPEGIIELKEVLLDDEAGTVAKLNAEIKAAATKDTPPAEYRRLVQEKKKFLKEAEQSPQGQTVNTTLDALQRVAMFSNPTTQQSVLAQAKADALKKAGARPKAAVSLDAPVGDESGAVLGDFVTGKGAKGLSGATSAATEAKDFEAEQGEVSEEEAVVIKEKQKIADKIVESTVVKEGLEASLGALRKSLTPAQQIAFDWIRATDKKTKDKIYGQLENRLEQDGDETSPRDIIADTQSEIAEVAQRLSGRTLSPAGTGSIGEPISRGSAGLEGGTLNRASTTESVRRIKRRFLQARAGLTDEQIVAMADDEIDRAFLAFNSRADESKAAKAQDAVVSVAPGIEDLQALSTQELLSEYAKQIREEAEAGDMGRDANFAELVRLGAFASTREFLARAADPKNGLPRDMQLRAKAFLGLEKRGFKLDAIEIQAANFLKTGTPDRASWAGLLGRSADYKSFGVYINLDQAHDRNPAQTILHELGHIPVMLKKHGVIKTTPEEKQALADLESMRRRAILRAGDASPTIKAEAEAQGITDPRDRTAFYETRLRELSSTDPEFRDYNGLTRDEFEVEMIGSPEFLDLLRRLGFGGADTDRKSLGGMIRDAFKAILKLVAPGISASSEIGKAFTDSWNLTYAGSKPVVKAGELLQATRGITEVKEAAPVPKKGTVKKSQKAAPQGGKGSVTSDSNNPSTPEPANPEVPTDGQAGEGSGAKVRRDKPGRPPKRELRDQTKLPVSREEFEAEMAQGGMTAEEREAEFDEAPQSPAAPIERYGDALLRIARERGSSLFFLPYNAPGADSKNLKTVLDSFGGVARFSVLESTDGQKFVSLTDDLKVGDAVVVPGHFLLEGADNSTVTSAKITAIQDGVATIQEEDIRTNTSALKNYPIGQIVKQKTFIRVESQPPGRFVIDSSQGGNGKILMSDAIYQGIYRWAKNNGAKIVPDSSTSFAGNMRRNAHQLSSALREQSAEHFVPTDDQLSKMFPDKPEDKRLLWWNSRNTAQRVEALARAEVNYVEQLIPDLVQLTYDPTSDSIMEAGKSLDNERGRQRVREILERAKGEGPSDTDRVGERTAYRYLAAKSWLSASQEQPWRSGSLGSSGTLDTAFMSPAGDLKKTVAKLTGQEIITTPSGGTYEKGGLLSTDGKLDKRAGDRWRKRNMKIGAQERMVNLAVQKLVAAVKGERKAGREVSMDLMNTALGNLDNPLTRPQRNEVEALRAEAKEAKPKKREAIEKEANELEAAYMAKNREAFKVRQAQALAQLPEDVAEAISEMTQHITALSSALKASGIVEPGLGATIDANLGIYLHRSYEIFDNPKWKEAVLKNEKIINDAQNLLRRNIEGRNADKLIAQAAEQGGILPRAEAMRQARGTAKQDEVDRMLEQLLAVGEESLGGVILRGRIPGQMDLSILDSRGNITPEIQALWGRYEDPTINYAKTALKITTLLENNAFLGDLRSLGLKEGWLHEGDDHPPGYLKISSDNNKSLAPIAGLYGNRDLVEALYAMYPQNGVEENYAWVRFFSKLTGVSMASKTVLSAAAHVRNFAGNFLNLAASGNLGINDLPFLSGGRYKKALNLTIRSTFSNMSAQQFKETIKELTELGVLNESLTSGLLKDLIGTKRVAGNALAFSDSITDRILKKPAAAIWDVAQKSYGSGDEFFKVVIYLSEMEKYRKAMPEWSEQQLKENAAKIARDVHWTYSLSPVAVGKIKQFPFVAPFITFTTEVIRTTRNTMALAYNEIKEGKRTGNKELTAIGLKRVRGMGVAALIPSMFAGFVGRVAGISGEDDDDLRRFLPDWQKNSQLMVFRNKDGKVSFIDVSYLDPYEYWKRPITAFLRAIAAPDDSSAMERITEGAVQAGAQLLNPFASEQILSGAILDIARNQKQDGGQLWNPEDTGARVAAKIGDHLWNAFEPGTLTSAGRIKDAALGNVSDSGRSYGLGNEVASVLLGQRVSELDVTQALGFKTSRTSRALRDASMLFTREFSSKGTRSDAQIMDAYNRANDATFEIAKDYREDVDAAMRLSGMTAKQISEIASAGGLGKEKIKMILSGRFTRYAPSKDQIKLAKVLGNQDRITLARQAESAAPKVRELR